MMIRMDLSEAAAAIGAEQLGANVRFEGCNTDSRTIEPGELFVALRGVNFDGHRYVDAARARGARAALVCDDAPHPLPVLRVADTLRGLGDLARHWRRGHRLPVVAITGSNGKTTVKEMVAAILRERGKVLATRGNLNNEIGVPLTLLGLGTHDHAAVIEMGANHAGEIRRLCEMAEPSVAVITQCAPAHLEGFGSVEGVARAKGEIIESLAPEGVAVVNADDDFAGYWRDVAGARQVIGFAMEAPADVRARWESTAEGGRVVLDTPVGRIETALRLPGRHSALNAAAAAAAAIAIGGDAHTIARGLAGMSAVAGRLRPIEAGPGITVIDDTYNANPTSLAIALRVLGERDGTRWLVLGDMAELGEDSDRYHEEAGRMARDAGVDRLVAIGPGCRLAVESFGPGARHFGSRETLCRFLREALDAPATVLVKGSRSMQMEQVVSDITASADGEASPCC